MGFAALAIALPWRATDMLWLALPLVLGLAATILVPGVGSTARAVPYVASETDARRISTEVLRAVTTLRCAVALAPTIFGYVVSIAAQSLIPATIGEIFAVPILVALVYPRTAVVEAVRRRLETHGVTSYVWDEANLISR